MKFFEQDSSKILHDSYSLCLDPNLVYVISLSEACFNVWIEDIYFKTMIDEGHL